MQDDQKGSQEPDPWAGLEADGAGAEGEGFTFSFDEIDAEQTEAPSLGEAGPPAAADGAAFGISPEAGEISPEADEVGRLSIFPPADADAAEAAAELPPDDDRPAPRASQAASEDVADPAAPWGPEFSAVDAEQPAEPADGFGDDFDAELARELAEDLGQAPAQASSSAADLDPAAGDLTDMGSGAGFGQGFAAADHDTVEKTSGGSEAGEFGFGNLGFDESGDGASSAEDAASAGSGLPMVGTAAASESPFAVNGGDGSFPADGAASDAVAGVATAAAITAGAAAAADSGARQRKKSSGLGQMVGVAAGGLMALPITYAILIWGFQKDPFKLGRQLPPQLAVLLPQKLQPGAKSQAGRAKPDGKQPGATGSLDDLAATAVLDDTTAQTDDAQPADDPQAEPQAEGEMQPGDKPEAADPGDVADTKPGDEPGSDPAEPGEASAVTPPPATAGDLADLAKEEMKEEPAEPTEPPPADDTAAATEPAKPAPEDLAAALPAIGGLPELDPGPPAAAAVAEPLPLDLTRMEDAVERAAVALDAIGAPADDAENDPARDRQLVSWYKRLARVGEELVRLEIEAADSSRPLDETPTAAAGLLERIGGDEVAVADLERLGRMWLTKRAQRAAGAAIVATLEGSRQVGPYWITHTTVVDANAEEPGRKVTIVSRRPPPAEFGDRVIAAGVMFDDDTVWAAEVWPVGGVVGPDAPGDEMEDEMEDELGIGLEDASGIRERRPGRPPVTGLDEPASPAPAADAPESENAQPDDADAAAEKPEMKEGEETSEPTEPGPDSAEPDTADSAKEKPAGGQPVSDAAEDDAPLDADADPAPPAGAGKTDGARDADAA